MEKNRARERNYHYKLSEERKMVREKKCECMRKFPSFFPAFFFFLFLSFYLFSLPVESATQKFGHVDGVSLILLHPLMHQFDINTRRFLNTASQPRASEDPTEFINRLQIELNLKAKQIQQLDTAYAGKITGKSMSARKAWWTFWKRREGLRIQKNLLQEAINSATVHGNFYLNTTTDWAIMPVVIAISSSITEVCQYLRKNNDLAIIFDTSVFIQNRLSETDKMDLIPNNHWHLWGGNQISSENLQKTALYMKEQLARKNPKLRHRPFVAGSIDLSGAANNLLRDITLPSTEFKDNKTGDSK